MPSYNLVVIVGHVGRDAEVKFTPNGTAVTKFSVAVSEKWKDKQSGQMKERTDWLNVIQWRAENLAQYITKGKGVLIQGKIRTGSYEDKDGKKVYTTDIEADHITFIPKGEKQDDRSAAASAPKGRDMGVSEADLDDSIPF